MKKGKILRTLAIAGTCLCAPLLFSGCKKEDDKFYITFMANGETYKVYQTTENQNITNIPDPVKEGYTFDGWFSDENYENEIEDLAEYLQSNSKANTTLYAKFTINQYTIAFNTNGGSVVAPITQDYNTAVTKPADPTRDGYEFGGWFTDNETFTNEYIFSTMPVDGISLYAKWNEIFEVVKNENGITIVGLLNKSINEIIVPERIDGEIVNKIETDVFQNCTQLHSLVLPKTIDELNINMLQGCNNLKTLTISKFPIKNNLQRLYYLFYAETIGVPDSLTTVILKDMETVPTSAFAGCYNVSEVVIPNSVSTIENSAFSSCPLKQLNLPTSVISIGTNVFNLSNLTSIEVADGNGVYKSDNNCLIKKSTNELIVGCVNSVIPDYVTKIAERAFKNTQITELTINNNITQIGKSAFSGCEKLNIINLNANLANFKENDNIFYDLGLDTDGVTLNIGNNVRKIPDYFLCSSSEQGTNLKIINFKSDSTCTTIGKHAFASSKITEISIPYSLTDIEDDAFHGCTKLNRVNIVDLNRWCNIYMGDNSYDNFEHTNPLAYAKNLYLNGSLITNLVIPNNITKIKRGIFCGGAFESVTLHDNITSIEEEAFSGCENIKNINLPDNLKDLGTRAFYRCYSLSEVNIGNVLTYINNGVFEDCKSLSSIILGTSIDRIWPNAFKNCEKLTSVVLNPSLKQINDDAFINCYALYEVYNLSELKLTIGNSNNGHVAYYAGVIFDNINEETTLFEENNIIYGSYDGNIEALYVLDTSVNSLTIKDGCKIIATNCIYGCNNITEIVIPNSVVRIENGAIDSCKNLTRVLLSDNLNFVDSCISNCQKITYNEYDNGYYLGSATNPYLQFVKVNNRWQNSVFIHNNTKFISYGAFQDSNITTIDIPDSVEYIGGSAFMRCEKLKSINVGLGVKKISKNTFYHCISLTTVFIAANVTEIEPQAFSYGCEITIVVIDSPTIANGLTSKTVFGYLIQSAKTIYIKSGLTVTNSTYMLENFTKQETSDKDGYDMYVKNS